MMIECPHCTTRYELPARLLGPGGAEVRCPRCRRNFMVSADGSVLGAAIAPARGAPPAPAPHPASAAAVVPRPPRAPEPAPSTEPAAVARAVLDELVAKSGAALAEANRRGRLFAEFGVALFAAYDEYRRRVGGGVEPGPFRDALRERWGIDLSSRWGEGR
jgi:predicted Zn finger-like uncharacterized protein